MEISFACVNDVHLHICLLHTQEKDDYLVDVNVAQKNNQSVSTEVDGKTDSQNCVLETSILFWPI